MDDFEHDLVRKAEQMEISILREFREERLAKQGYKMSVEKVKRLVQYVKKITEAAIALADLSTLYQGRLNVMTGRKEDIEKVNGIHREAIQIIEDNKKDSVSINTVFWAIVIGFTCMLGIFIYMTACIVNLKRDIKELSKDKAEIVEMMLIASDVDDLNHKVFPTGRMHPEESK